MPLFRPYLRLALLALAAPLALSACLEDLHKGHDEDPALAIDYPAAYVVNGTSNDLAVVRLSDLEHTETISLGGGTFPHHVYLNPAKTLLAVAITSTDLSGGHGGHGGHGGAVAGQRVQIINALTGQIERELPVPQLPHNAAFSPDGTELWISQADSESGHVLVYRTSDWSRIQTIQVGRAPSEITFSDDGSAAFAANTADGTVSMIDPVTKEVLRTIPVGEDPVGAWPAPNGMMYVDNERSRSISEIDVATGAVLATIELNFTPAYAAYSTVLDELWVTDLTQGGVVRFAKEAGQWMRVGEIPTGADAHAIAFSGDGLYAFVTNQGANTLSVIDVSRRAVSKTVPVGVSPNGLILRQ